MGRKSRSRKLETPSTPAPPASEGAARDDRRATLLILAGLIVLTLAVYARVAKHEFLEYDDNAYITHNTTVRQGLTMRGLRWAMTSMDFNWHPVTWVTHMVDVELFGLDAGKHHLVNVAIHCANVALLFLLLSGMTGARWRSAIVTALFAVHPLHVESVAWIAERKDVLSMFFFLLTLLLYVRWTRRPSAGTYVAALVAFLLGIASKQMLVTLPFVLLLLDYWPLRRIELNDGALIVRRAVEKIPFFVIAAAAMAVALFAQREVNAIVATEKLPLTWRLSNAVIAYAAYLRKTFVPAPLAMPYPYLLPSPLALATAAVVLLAITAAAIAYRDRRYLFTGWFWFAGTLVPVIGLVQIGSQPMADRYTYIPQIGLLAALVWLGADLAQRRNLQRPLAALAAIAVVVLAFVANAYAARWRDTESLFRHDLAVTERNYIAHSNLGMILYREAKFDEAREHFRAAIAIDPADVNALIGLADLDLKQGKRDEALKLLEHAMKVDPSARTQAKLALARNDIPKAIEQFRRAAAENPYLVENHVDLAACLALAGRDEEALAENRAALQLDPTDYDALMNTGALLSRMNRAEEALVDFRKASNARPSSPEPHVYLALLELQMGRRADALAEGKAAAQADRAASNVILTNALHIPFKPTNLDEFIAFLETGNTPPP